MLENDQVGAYQIHDSIEVLDCLSLDLPWSLVVLEMTIGHLALQRADPRIQL